MEVSRGLAIVDILGEELEMGFRIQAAYNRTLKKRGYGKRD
jgi:hypothetical protein